MTYLATVNADSPLFDGPDSEGLRRLLSEDESAEFKDVDSDTITKFDSGLGSIAGIKMDYVDFKLDETNQTVIVPHVRITVAESNLANDITSKLRFAFSGIDMRNHDVEMISDTVQVSESIERSFAIRLRFKDVEANNPARFEPTDYLETIKGIITDMIVRRITPQKNLTITGLPEYSISKDGTKEIWFKMVTGGVLEDPFALQDYLRGLENNIMTQVSVNEFEIEGLNVYPFGWLALEDYLASLVDTEEPPIPVQNKFTGTVILSDLSPEKINKLYYGTDPDTQEMNDAIRSLFDPLVATDIENLRVDYFEPIDDSTALGHFLFIQRDDSAKTSSDIVDVLDQQLGGIGDIGGRLSDPELSTTRRFKAHVSTPLSEDEIVARLQNETAAEFDGLSNFKELNGKKYFDIETDRNIGVQTGDLKTAIDEILGTTDAVVEVPGANLLPLRQWIAIAYLNVSTDEAADVLADWTIAAPTGTGLMANMPNWQLDYNSAFSETLVQMFLFGEFPFNTPRSNLEGTFEAQAGVASYILEYPRRFVGRCSFAAGADATPDPAVVNTTVLSLAQGISQTFPPVTTITVSYIELTGENSTVLFDTTSTRRRRQAEDEQPIMFKFSGGATERLIPESLQQQGRLAIASNPTLANVIDSETLIIEPDMFDPEKAPPTIPPTPETTTPPIITVPEPTKTAPPVADLPGVVVYEVDSPTVTDDELDTLEGKLNEKGKDAKCEARAAGEKSYVQCRVNVDSEDTLNDINLPPDGVTPDKNFTEDLKYIDTGGQAQCSNKFENDCHEFADCDDSEGTIACTCKDGYEDVVSTFVLQCWTPDCYILFFKKTSGFSNFLPYFFGKIAKCNNPGSSTVHYKTRTGTLLFLTLKPEKCN